MTAGGSVSVRLFGPAREAVGADAIDLALPERATAAEALAALAAAYPALVALLPRTRVAVNLAYVDPGTRLEPGDEIAIVPPVGGG